LNGLKALVIQAPFESDLGNIIQIARSEGMKIFHNPSKIRVFDVIRTSYGFIAVVQNGDGCISDKQEENARSKTT
jgi:hypothetical protein